MGPTAGGQNVAHLVDKVADTILHKQLDLSAAIPGIVLLVLTLVLFDAKDFRILTTWVVGFGIYLSIHALFLV
ncbi:MAG: hypothetical protein OXG25_01750 [Gammaproteobacteria bacterium]|nr:hypothetical protein [Gammaproteobacteria bacterium]